MRLKQNDWDILFKKHDYIIGTTTLKLIPLSLENLPGVVSEFLKISGSLIKEGITTDNYVSKLKELSILVANKAPGLISIMSGLHEDDIKKLPIPIVVSLLTECIKVNIEDQEDFLKNLMALADKVGDMATVSSVISDA